VDLRANEERLRGERRDLAETLEHINALFSRSQTDDTGELSIVDQHIADVATETESRELDIMRRKLVEDRLALIDEALERIATGRYGRCVVCDEPIQEERLEALPWTPYCLTHATLEPSPVSPPPRRAR
jgi:RNA polymerase-binding transcription factor DksA